MDIYLMQHGLALDKEADPERHLSDAGLNAVRRVANRAAELGLELGTIYHSGKARSQQSAEMLAEALNRRELVDFLAGLNPKDPVVPYLDWLQQRSAEGVAALTLVGHLPSLARLTALLVTGSEGQSIVAFENAGLVKLIPDPDREHRYLVSWILSPSLVL
ncbi:MAG: phosphohistidine phosphatase SixA [Oceanospirillaceae bacterium]|nr:phosphohistidine phosphatase SixA [Oceanospirillaceae bacterium]